MTRLRGIAVLMAAALVTAALLTHVMRDRVQVCYTLQSSGAAHTQVYWAEGGVFSEAESVRQPVNATDQRRVCLSDEPAVDHGRVRIDPVDRQGVFLLEDVTVRWRASLFPVLTDVAMDNSALLQRHDAAPQGGRYVAATNDPYFVWRFDARTGGKLHAVNWAVAALGIGFIVFLSGLGRGGSMPDGRRYLQAAGLFGLYPAFLIVAWLAKDLHDLTGGSRYVFFWCLILVAVYLRGAVQGVVRREAVPYLVACSLLLMIVGFDVWYRAGWTDGQPFVKVSHDAYNWRLNRAPSENRDNSSLAYYEDIGMIRGLVEPGSYFVSDRATGYYVAAALPLYPRVAQRHHISVEPEYWDFLEALCADGDPDVDQAAQDMLALEGAEQPFYAIIALDGKNRNLANSCLNDRYPVVEDRLSRISRLVYDGEYLKVFNLGMETL